MKTVADVYFEESWVEELVIEYLHKSEEPLNLLTRVDGTGLNRANAFDSANEFLDTWLKSDHMRGLIVEYIKSGFSHSKAPQTFYFDRALNYFPEGRRRLLQLTLLIHGLNLKDVGGRA